MEPTSNDARKSAPKTSNDRTGHDYLADQIADARLALESTLDDLTLDLSQAADVRRWVRRYPWAALGTALVAGFTIGHVITKSRTPAKDELPTEPAEEPIRRHSSNTSSTTVAGESSARPESSGTWRTMILSALFDILRLAVTQIVSASVRQAASRSAQPHAPAGNDNPEASDTTKN